MKIKHYIVTYKNSDILNKSLESLLPTFQNYSKEQYQCFIINNHSDFYIEPKFSEYVVVLDNTLRPDFSTGHLARNWNQSIINGFVDIDNPDCDILITSQNDCEFDGDFIPNLINFHKDYSFIQFGAGDNFISYTIDSIKKVGIWDERFCNIGYQEADYFLRQMLFNTNASSINDSKHKRVHNGLINNIIKHTKSGYDRGDIFHKDSINYHKISELVYTEKWGDTPINHALNGWNYDKLKDLRPNISSYIYYPYFEKNIISIKEQKYII
jgi:hypothetical protein